MAFNYFLFIKLLIFFNCLSSLNGNESGNGNGNGHFLPDFATENSLEIDGTYNYVLKYLYDLSIHVYLFYIDSKKLFNKI